jgi:hypothetical protein
VIVEELVTMIAFAFLLFAAVVLTLIFRDVFSLLNPEDQLTISHWIGKRWKLKTRVINSIWSRHATAFPTSRKRFLFVLFLTAFVIVAVGHQVWRFAF